jgi:hypothetical protein
MSNPPLCARLFGFLAVVASASFIVFMLDTGSHADQNTSVVSSPTSSSKSPLIHLPEMRHLAQDTPSSEMTCAKCVAEETNDCMAYFGFDRMDDHALTVCRGRCARRAVRGPPFPPPSCSDRDRSTG